LNQHALYLSGAIEIQDEGSQLLGLLVAPARRQMVVDFCAGSGGKTLLLGAMMRDQGRLYAFDISAKRLESLKQRVKRARLTNIHPQLMGSERDPRIARLAGKIDRVLVDAPCSGLGTLRRSPGLKWRQTPTSVNEWVAMQSRILQASSQLVKPGGRLVYATCSLLAAENEEVVAAFLESQNGRFCLVNCQSVLEALHIQLDTGPYFRVLPDEHRCDGFFAALIERTAAA
jgi:16S rRNA (cytosine967-C5)-methyltransferase